MAIPNPDSTNKTAYNLNNMPHINVNENLPGIRALLAFSPETAEPIGVLAENLLRTSDSLTMADRELIGMYVSHLNHCFYCDHSHGEIAICHLHGDRALVDAVRFNYEEAAISDKLKSLFQIAGKVQQGGKFVLPEDIENARKHGTTDHDIHDTVLIAAAFCMMNRYVDGLDAVTPSDMSSYPLRARQIVEKGYGNHIFLQPQPEKK
jgi:uncharacterized peroxidase-related enzyme